MERKVGQSSTSSSLRQAAVKVPSLAWTWYTGWVNKPLRYCRKKMFINIRKEREKKQDWSLLSDLNILFCLREEGWSSESKLPRLIFKINCALFLETFLGQFVYSFSDRKIISVITFRSLYICVLFRKTIDYHLVHYMYIYIIFFICHYVIYNNFIFSLTIYIVINWRSCWFSPYICSMERECTFTKPMKLPFLERKSLDLRYVYTYVCMYMR